LAVDDDNDGPALLRECRNPAAPVGAARVWHAHELAAAMKLNPGVSGCAMMLLPLALFRLAQLDIAFCDIEN
jgi:hypothetical protein